MPYCFNAATWLSSRPALEQGPSQDEQVGFGTTSAAALGMAIRPQSQGIMPWEAARSRRRVSSLVILLAGLATLAARTVEAQGFSPEEAAGRMTVADGFEVQLVAAEPLVRQPVAIEFDDRGRLWVIQYLQYPNPAGLKRVKVDRYSRTVYDRVPEPPPRGPKGADRITILEDTDGDGRADRAKDFVTGLNLASGLAFGHGGVFVLQAPYLLFYPDRDRDDVPDGDPEVLLTGFGMEDAHSVANSLTWGPDGWLYGCQGSTVTANIRGIEFQQGVWRYHPLTQAVRAVLRGRRQLVGPRLRPPRQALLQHQRRRLRHAARRPGRLLLEVVRQARPAAQSVHVTATSTTSRTTDFSGGHVTVGGIVYRGRRLARRLARQVTSPPTCSATRSTGTTSTPLGSTFRARHGGDLLRANDTWFAPSDVTLGPDGAVYVADWHDRRTAHPDPDADWDRTNGRIYRIAAQGAKPAAARLRPGDASRTTSSSPCSSHPNVWYRRKARRLLAERRDPEALPTACAATVLRRPRRRRRSKPSGRCTAAAASTTSRPSVCSSTPTRTSAPGRVRLLGDEPTYLPPIAARLVELAGREPDVTVRSQLACTARRLAPAAGLDVAQRLLAARPGRRRPAHSRSCSWWAVERHALADLDETARAVHDARSLASRHGPVGDPGRLVRRFAAEGAGAAMPPAPGCLPRHRRPRRGGRSWPRWTRRCAGGGAGDGRAGLARARRSTLADDDPGDVTLTRLAARLGDRAGDRAGTVASPPTAARAAGGPRRDARAPGRAQGPRVRRSAPRPGDAASSARPCDWRPSSALGRFDDDAIADGAAGGLPASGRGLAGPGARAALEPDLVGAGLLWRRSTAARSRPAKDVTLDQLGAVRRRSRTPDLAALVRKHWGVTRGATPRGEARRGPPAQQRPPRRPRRPGAGPRLFRERCATCHRLFGEGETIGPDLTYANRQDRDFLLSASSTRPESSARSIRRTMSRPRTAGSSAA